MVFYTSVFDVDASIQILRFDADFSMQSFASIQILRFAQDDFVTYLNTCSCPYTAA